MNEIVKVDNTDLKIDVINNKPMVSSLDIAEKFEKRHDVVIRAIENDDAYSEFLRDHKIVVSEYKVKNNNKTYKEYLLDRDAFSYYVMGFTGEKSKRWKLNYIKAFNMMEEKLKNSNKFELPKTYIEALEALVSSEKEKLALKQKIEKDKPKVEFATQIENAVNSILIGNYAKMLAEENKVRVGQNRLFKWLRDNGYLIKSGRRKNMPKQEYINNGFFEVKTSTVVVGTKVKEYNTTLITGKGQIALANKIIAYFKGENY